jgi:hypothetical protein
MKGEAGGGGEKLQPPGLLQPEEREGVGSRPTRQR